MSAEQAASLEQALTRNSRDIESRARLLGFYFYSARRYLGIPQTIQARRHILWLIGARPESALAGSSEATIDRAGHSLADPQGYEEARTAWIAQTGRKEVTPQILANAARFFLLPEKGLAIEMLKRARALDPGNLELAGRLGEAYATAILGITGQNQNGLPSVADLLRASRKGPVDSSALAEELLLRARDLGPGNTAATMALSAIYEVRAMENQRGR